MVGAHLNLNGSCDLTKPFSGIFCPRARTCYDHLPTKFEVFVSTYYEDKGILNLKNGVVCGS